MLIVQSKGITLSHFCSFMFHPYATPLSPSLTTFVWPSVVPAQNQKMLKTETMANTDHCNHIVLCTNINYRSHQSSAELLNIYNYLMLQFHAIKLVYPIGKDIQYSIWITKVGNLRPNMMPITSKFHLPPTPTLQKKKQFTGIGGKAYAKWLLKRKTLKSDLGSSVLPSLVTLPVSILQPSF